MRDMIGWWWMALAIPVLFAFLMEGMAGSVTSRSTSTMKREYRRALRSKIGRGLSHVSLSAGGEGVLALIGLSVGVFTAGIGLIAIGAARQGNPGLTDIESRVLYACWTLALALFIGAILSAIHIASDAERRRATLEGLHTFHRSGTSRKNAILNGLPIAVERGNVAIATTDIDEITRDWRIHVYQWLSQNDPEHLPIWTTGRPFPMGTKYPGVTPDQSNAALSMDVELQKLVDIMQSWERR